MALIYKNIGGVNFIDPQQLWASIKGVDNDNRSRELMKNAGVTFFDEQYDFISKPAVGIIGIGGLPITLNKENSFSLKPISDSTFDLESLRFSILQMMGYGGFCSYLNPNDKEAEELTAVMLKHGHYSTAHLATFNIMVMGISTAVENEFNSQKDLIHFARLTEARTIVQSNPPLVVLYPELLSKYKEIKERITVVIKDLAIEQKDLNMLESQNLLYPAAKGTLFIMTASLRNLQKLVGCLDDKGKEEEYKRAIALLNDSLYALFPEMFKPTLDYGYKYPSHF